MGIRLQASRLALICVCLSLSQAASGSLDVHPVFRLLDVPGGLPDQHVEAIVQDIHGYIWIGTRGGLIRHEGREMRLLPRDPEHPDALPDNNITSLHAHSDGMVWAGVSGAGVVEIGPDLRPRRHLAPVSAGGPLPHALVWAMAEDCEGALWIAFMQGGLARFDPRSEQLLVIPQEEAHGLSEDAFQMQLAFDAECRLWLAQSDRLVVATPNGAETRFETVIGAAPDPRDIFVDLIGHSHLGILATRGSELLRAETPQAGNAVPAWQVLAELDGIITGLAELPDQRVVASTATGLGFFDPQSGAVERVFARPDLPDALPVLFLAGATLVDREGAIWMALAQRGLAYLAPDHAAFARLQRGFVENQDFELQRVEVTATGKDDAVLWLGGVGGVQRVDLQSGRIEHARDLFPDAWETREVERATRGLWEHPDGLLVLGGMSLSRLSPELDEVETRIHSSDFQNTTFTFLLPAGPDSAWIGTTSAGLLHYDLASREITRFGPDQPDPYLLPEQAPAAMIRAEDGQFLLAGFNRIYRHAGDGGFALVEELERGRIVDLAFSPDGTLWIAQDAGLSQWRWNGEQVERIAVFDVQRLTESASIRQVFPQANDEVWLVLSNGVARLHPSSGQTRLFTRSDGLPVAEFAPRAGLALASGQIAVGGSRGLLLLNPARIRDQALAPPVHLTRMAAADLEYILVPGPRSPIALDWQQNAVRFEFSALTYVAPERVRYRVRLHGWDDAWIELRERGEMYYSNLRSGRYQFQVQAAAEADNWSETGDTVTIDIAAPPWASPAAFAAYAGVLMLGLAGAWRGARQSRRRRQYLAEIQQKRALAEEQRQLIERLNADLEPIPLARAISAEMLNLTAARQSCFAYLHEQMPRELVLLGDGPRPTREQWRAEADAADGHGARVVALSVDDQPMAKVVLKAPDSGFLPDHEQRLELLLDLAGQALHNSLLLQRVKRLAERAETANEAKSEFLATMSHEIRTPLHGVMGMADLLYESEDEPGRLELINTLRASGRQLQRVIDDVLDISRIESGRLGIHTEAFELVSLIEHVIDLHAANAARKGLDLRLRVASNVPAFSAGDADRLAQILGNLLSNAVKFTERGAVELSVELDRAGQLRFAVRDSGPGIGETDRDKLFQPFSQLDASIRRAHGGSGLGLAICRRLAESMGGQLVLDRQRWPGSSFVLTLPHHGPAVQQPLSRLLNGIELVALLDAPSYQITLQLTRHWGFGVRNGWRCAPGPADLLLIDQRCLGLRPVVEEWLRVCPAGLCLEPSYGRDGSEPGPAPESFRILRWPLLEGRLVAALIDGVLNPPPA